MKRVEENDTMQYHPAQTGASCSMRWVQIDSLEMEGDKINRLYFIKLESQSLSHLPSVGNKTRQSYAIGKYLQFSLIHFLSGMSLATVCIMMT